MRPSRSARAVDPHFRDLFSLIAFWFRLSNLVLTRDEDLRSDECMWLLLSGRDGTCDSPVGDMDLFRRITTVPNS
jgi:hypothetical protein